MTAPRSSRVTYIVLRYMRRPIMVLIAVYAVSMVGWILIPGVDAEGNQQELSFFHAFYFLTYTVTTTGFGELPYTFTEAQRMWGIVSLYAGVIAWFYALGSIVGLVQNTDFQQSVAERRFAKRVARISEPFYVICGYGNTGALLTRGLSDAGMTVVVVERNPERIKTAMLRDYGAQVAALNADARIPEHLVEAGLRKPNCKAVIALTQDEDVNLKIAVTARLLNPAVWVVTQSTSPVHEDTLATLGDNVHIVDPFQTYAHYLSATLTNPKIHTLNHWLVGADDGSLDNVPHPPRGTWILCGYGRMGHWLRDMLEAQGMETVIIEPAPRPEDRALENLIIDRASQQSLLDAGIGTAAGIVAATDHDSDNLGILLNARALNPEIFFVVRQNRYRNQVLFEAAEADLIMMPSLVSARRILLQLIAPMLKPLFETLRRHDAEGDGRFLDELIERLRREVGGRDPRLWTVDTGAAADSALTRLLADGARITLAHLLSDPVDRDRRLHAVPLVLRSGGEMQVLPPASTPLAVGDEILFCGDARAWRLIDANMANEYTLRYLMTGRDEPRSWVMQWLAGRLAGGSGRA